MKANEAPEKIYVHVRANKELGTTWHGTQIGVHDIEYTHTDAFIEKAEKWLNEHILDYVYAKEWGQGVGVEVELFDNFKEYMKGE